MRNLIKPCLSLSTARGFFISKNFTCLILSSNKIVLDNTLKKHYNILMKNENIDEMDLHEAILFLERKHNCMIYGVLEMEGLEEDLSHYDLGVRSLNKVSRQEWRDAMEYAFDSNESALSNEYGELVDLIADYLIDNHIANPINTLGGYSSG